VLLHGVDGGSLKTLKFETLKFEIENRGIDDNLLLSEDAMARAVITTDFASPAETAHVLGVSRANRENLVRMAELAVSRTRSRRGKAGNNGARTISRKGAQAPLDRNRFF
jgi:hypothetical protein